MIQFKTGRIIMMTILNMTKKKNYIYMINNGKETLFENTTKYNNNNNN
jgi:hypothetical protein